MEAIQQISIVGSLVNTNIKEVSLGSVTVTAGTTLNLTPVDVADSDQITLGLTPSTTHTHTGLFRFTSSDGVQAYTNSDKTPLISASSGNRISDRQPVLGAKVVVRITNGDASDRSYIVFVNKIGLKLS